MEDISLLVAFAAGLASFLSPCVLPMVPVYLASLAGPDIFQVKSRPKRLPIFMHSLSFVIGFTVVFSLWGAGIGLIGSIFAAYSMVIRYIVGSLLIIFGMLMLAALRVPRLNYERRLNLSTGAATSYLRSFLTGSVFCLAWTPCLGPILAGILSIAGGSGTALNGAYLLAVYSLGLGVPFLIIGVAFDALTPFLKRMNRYSSIIYIISGLLLITMGVLILTNNLTWFSSLI